MEQKMSQKTKSSVGAFYASESGVEWALNKIATSDSSAYINTLGLTFNSDNSAQCPFGGCGVFFLKAGGTVITDRAGTRVSDIEAVRSVGTQGGETQRAIEAAVAATEKCNAVPTEIDSEHSSMTIKDAATVCRNMGSCWHLPSHEELVLFSGISSATAQYLWTTTVSNSGDGSLEAVRLSDGKNDDNNGSYNDLNIFRCVR
jgi:hypothetical protein